MNPREAKLSVDLESTAHRHESAISGLRILGVCELFYLGGGTGHLGL